MNRILKSPARYVQGAGVLYQFDQYLDGMGKNLLILISQNGMKRICPTLEQCFAGKDYQLHYELFKGECSQNQMDRLLALARELGSTAIVGIGGGKILDTAKGVAHHGNLPVVIVPTVASTDSPCSALSVVYTDEGEFDKYLFLRNCPNMVLVDTDVIVKAPVDLLVAGMGDAMSTWFEARACRAGGYGNQLGGWATDTAMGMAKMCWELLERCGAAAKAAVEKGECTEDVETIVEVNTYLSSVGFESGGLAAAHATQKGFTFIPQLHEQYHGNKVAFCVLTQLVLEEAAETEDVLRFCCSVGLPVCFADLGYTDIDHDRLRLAAEKACVPTATIHHMPFPVTPDMVYQAMLKADALGSEWKRSHP